MRPVQFVETRVSGLLHASRERPCRGAAEQRDEVAALQPIKLHAVLHQPGQDCRGFANPRQARLASPVGVWLSSARGGTVFGANEAQVADDFIAAAMVRRMVDAVDHWHVGKIKRAHAF